MLVYFLLCILVLKWFERSEVGCCTRVTVGWEVFAFEAIVMKSKANIHSELINRTEFYAFQ